MLEDEIDDEEALRRGARKGRCARVTLRVVYRGPESLDVSVLEPQVPQSVFEAKGAEWWCTLEEIMVEELEWSVATVWLCSRD